MAFSRIETSDYTGKDIAGLVDAPSEAGMTALQLKARFDSLIKDLVALRINDMVDKLNATTASSGASHVGFYATVKAPYNNVQQALAEAYNYTDTQITNAVFGGVSPLASNVSVTDALGHFTGVNVETVLEELYQAIQSGSFDYVTVLDGAISTYLTANASLSKVIVSDASGKLATSALDSAILAHLSTISSNVQTQLNAKQATITGGATTIDTENLTANMTLVSDANGKVAVSANITVTELDFLNGVTSAIQTQLNGKMSGAKTISASQPSGGASGDIWFVV